MDIRFPDLRRPFQLVLLSFDSAVQELLHIGIDMGSIDKVGYIC
jgi:hypothetical protein